MSTRDKNKNLRGIFKNPASDEYSIPEDFEIPSCTIEDVDRALFELFDKDLPFTFKHKEGTRKSPVIFASGERFAVLRRKKPLRDKSGVLILPLVSIMRTGITQSPSMGAGTSQNQRIVIKQKLAESDNDYQKIINKANILNSDDISIGSKDARVVSKEGNANVANNPDQKNLTNRNTVKHKKATLNPKIGDNIFEVITMAPPKYYTASYEITFWAQYTSQMNDMIMALMTLYQSYSQRTFRLETKKGYWFVAYVDEELSPGNNFDEFTDSERLIRYSFSLKVPAYILGASYPGSKSNLKKYYSAPVFNFGIETTTSINKNNKLGGIFSGAAKDYILDDLRTDSDELPGQFIGSKASANLDIKSKVTGSEVIGGKEV